MIHVCLVFKAQNKFLKVFQEKNNGCLYYFDILVSQETPLFWEYNIFENAFLWKSSPDFASKHKKVVTLEVIICDITALAFVYQKGRAKDL